MTCDRHEGFNRLVSEKKHHERFRRLVSEEKQLTRVLAESVGFEHFAWCWLGGAGSRGLSGRGVCGAIGRAENVLESWEVGQRYFRRDEVWGKECGVGKGV